MNKKISELGNANPLLGDELIPVVQGGGNGKTTPLATANFIAGIPAGMTPFRVVPFGGCVLDPSNDETIMLLSNSGGACALQYCTPDGEGGMTVTGLLGGRPSTGMFLYALDNTLPFTFENIGGIAINALLVMNAAGNLVDNSSHVVFNRSAGQQAAITNATGTGDVVAQLNAVLAALRNLGLIAP